MSLDSRRYRRNAGNARNGCVVAPLVFICYLLFAICYSFEPKARVTVWTLASSRNSALSWEIAA
jgi:uncharacterized BrkB/YihY/UPF0761 family membrane protein